MEEYEKFKTAWEHIRTLKGSNAGEYYCNFVDSKIAFEEDEIVMDELLYKVTPKRIERSFMSPIMDKLMYCPSCNGYLSIPNGELLYCYHCGQALKE